MAPPLSLRVAPDAAAFVRPAWRAWSRLTVREGDDRLDEPLRGAARLMRAAADAPEITSSVRAMYRRAGIDPTKTRPSSEALLRRARRGDELPRINSLVDVVNWCSLESRLPFGLYDADRLHGEVTLRLGGPGEQYDGIRKDTVHVAGRLTLADDVGPFGNPTSDSARTMVTTGTTRALVVVFVPAALDAVVGEEALARTADRIDRFCT